MTTWFSNYTATHMYPRWQASILLHGYSAAIDWVKPEIARLLSPGATLNVESLSYETLTTLRVRGYLTECDPGEERRYVRKLLSLLATKQVAPFDLILSNSLHAATGLTADDESRLPLIDQSRLAEGLQALLKTISPSAKTSRLARITLNLSEPALSQNKVGELVSVVSSLPGVSGLMFEFYLRVSDSNIGLLADLLGRLQSPREIEVLADGESVAMDGYCERLIDSLSSIFARSCPHHNGHPQPYLAAPLRWTCKLAGAARPESAKLRKILLQLEEFGINPTVLWVGDQIPSDLAAEVPMLLLDEYDLLTGIRRFFSGPTVFSYHPFFSQAPAVLSVGLDGRCFLSRLPYSPNGVEVRSLDEAGKLLERGDPAPAVERLVSAVEESFCFRCSYCLICGGNPFVSEAARASVDCSRDFHQKIGAILPLLSRRIHESE